MKGVLIGIIFILIYQSPDLRNKTASVFRTAADWISTEEVSK